MTEADRELYHAYRDAGAAVGSNMDMIVDCVLFFPMLVFGWFFLCYLFSWRKLQRRERVLFIAVEVARIAAIIAVKDIPKLHGRIPHEYGGSPNEINERSQGFALPHP